MNILFSAAGSEENREAMIALLASVVLVAVVSVGARLMFKGHFLANAEEAPVMVIEGVIR